MSAELSLKLGLLAALLFLSGFFSSSETSLFSLLRQPLDRERLKQHKGGEAAESLLAEPERTLATVLFGNELVNVSLSAVCASLVVKFAPDKAWLNLLIATPILVIVGEVLPKSLAYRFRVRWASAIARPLQLWATLITPLRFVLLGVATAITRRLGADPDSGPAPQREEQFRQLIDEGHGAGTIKEMERDLIHQIFEFSEVPVSRLMTPRPDVVSIPLDLPYDEIIAAIQEHQISRIPVYQDVPDDVVGVLLTKDLLRFSGRSAPTPAQLEQLLQPPMFVPSTKPADELLRKFQKSRTHMALIVDEHGSIAGLATLDDLLGELLGELVDAAPDDGEEISRIMPNLWTVAGSTDVEDFAEQTGISLPPGEYHTVAGFLLDQLGRIPAEGELVEHEGALFAVKAMEGRRITEVTVQSGSARPSASPFSLGRAS